MIDNSNVNHLNMKNMNGMNGVGKHPNAKQVGAIKCNVSNCVHNNKHYGCTAKEVTVGPTFANSSADTVCATFRAE